VDDLAATAMRGGGPISITASRDSADMMARIGRLRDQEIHRRPDAPSRICGR